MREADLDPDDYIVGRFDHIIFDEIKVPAEIVTFDKPRLVSELSQTSEARFTMLNPSLYDRVIDATGVARAYLPQIQNDLKMRCIQIKVRSKGVNELKIKPGGVGYAWRFPIGDYVHIGCGSLRDDPEKIMRGLTQAGWITDEPVVCGCRGTVRLSGPNSARPFVVNGSTQIWGVGEAVGCVSPMAGDGVVSGMRSVQIFIDNWDDPEGYSETLLREFSWMDRERRVVDKLEGSGSPSILDARILMENSRRMGMRIGVIDALRMVRSLIRS